MPRIPKTQIEHANAITQRLVRAGEQSASALKFIVNSIMLGDAGQIHRALEFKERYIRLEKDLKALNIEIFKARQAYINSRRRRAKIDTQIEGE